MDNNTECSENGESSGNSVSRQSFNDDIGTVCISDEVVMLIAGMAAIGVKGVAGMGGAGGIVEALSRKGHTKGVKVDVGEEEAIIDIYIVVDYGTRIPDVAWEVQENVKNSVESITGLRVLKVNIHVQGIIFPSKKDRGKDTSDEEIMLLGGDIQLGKDPEAGGLAQ